MSVFFPSPSRLVSVYSHSLEITKQVLTQAQKGKGEKKKRNWKLDFLRSMPIVLGFLKLSAEMEKQKQNRQFWGNEGMPHTSASLPLLGFGVQCPDEHSGSKARVE